MGATEGLSTCKQCDGRVGGLIRVINDKVDHNTLLPELMLNHATVLHRDERSVRFEVDALIPGQGQIEVGSATVTKKGKIRFRIQRAYRSAIMDLPDSDRY